MEGQKRTGFDQTSRVPRNVESEPGFCHMSINRKRFSRFLQNEIQVMDRRLKMGSMLRAMIRIV